MFSSPGQSVLYIAGGDRARPRAEKANSRAVSGIFLVCSCGNRLFLFLFFVFVFSCVLFVCYAYLDICHLDSRRLLLFLFLPDPLRVAQPEPRVSYVWATCVFSVATGSLWGGTLAAEGPAGGSSRSPLLASYGDLAESPIFRCSFSIVAVTGANIITPGRWFAKLDSERILPKKRPFGLIDCSAIIHSNHYQL